VETDPFPDHRGKAIVGNGYTNMEEGGFIKGTAPPDSAGATERIDGRFISYGKPDQRVH